MFHVLYLAAGCDAFVKPADVEEGWCGSMGWSMFSVSAPWSNNVSISHRITHGDVHNPAASFSKGSAPVAYTHALQLYLVYDGLCACVCRQALVEHV